jgi:hypothetical protein
VNRHGYDIYNDEFKQKYIECIGNYLLVSKSHNCSVGNYPFREKYATYTYLEQQKEVQKLVNYNEDGPWNRAVIQQREEVLTEFVRSHF